MGGEVVLTEIHRMINSLLNYGEDYNSRDYDYVTGARGMLPAHRIYLTTHC